MPASPRYAKPAGCAGCSLEHAGWGFVPPSGSEYARLVLVGESAGAEEIIAGEPFYGAAGGTLSRILTRVGIDRKHIRIANTISCRPPGDHLAGAAYEFAAITQCRQYLQPILDRVPDNAVVVPLGGTALQAILNLHGVAGVSVKNFHGTVTRDPSDRYWVVPTFHPSFLQRGAMNHLEVVTQDVTTAEKISREGFVRTPFSLVVDPPLEWFRGWVTAHLAKATASPDSAWLALDTEFRGKADDESEITDVRGVTLTRVNVANDTTTGVTVPYIGEYIAEVQRLLAGLDAIRGIVLLWHKYADWDPLRAAGHTIAEIEAYDLMWLWHHLQSDLPMALGFVAPMASNMGAWKHWGKVTAWEGQYAAADALQTYRVGAWLIPAAIQAGMWEPFVRDWHERDRYVLRPARAGGVPINKPALVAFHEELQRKLARILVDIKTTAAQGVLKPKRGYAKMPVAKIPAWFKSCVATDKKSGLTDPSTVHDFGVTHNESTSTAWCRTCDKTEIIPPVQPPASILGKPKKGGAEAKTAYMSEGVKLVEKQIEVEVVICDTCAAEDVGVKHRCPKPKVRKPRRRSAGECDPVVSAAPVHAEPLGGRRDHGDGDAGSPGPALRTATLLRARYFWQLPFNPDAPAQILAYLAQQGIAAPVDRKKQRATTNKQAMTDLAKQHSDDPFFQLTLDWKAVQKVDATYAVGTLNRLDSDDRVHPEVKPLPATLRDSCVGPNFQNVVADKAGPEGLASGFRKCVESRDGVPPGVTAEEYQSWETRWTS